jgi:acetyltransferase-like isoleucine patch superfamily enzyme
VDCGPAISSGRRNGGRRIRVSLTDIGWPHIVRNIAAGGDPLTDNGIAMLSIEGPNASEIPPETFGRSCSGRVVVRGAGNRVEIGENCKLTAVHIDLIGENNRLIIGDGVRYRGHILINSGSNQTIRIGARSTFQNVYLLCSEGKNITIGEECMFSREIEVRTTDAHSVIDVATGQRINAPGDIAIGDHVWIGLRSIIQPGVHIANDVIVGALSFVSKSIDESSVVAAGVPAEIKKRGVTWDRRRVDELPPDERWLNIIRSET